MSKALGKLHPNEIIRKHMGPKYFGLGATQLEEEIRRGTIPPPKVLSSNGRAKGWTGQQILDHQARLFEQEEDSAALTTRRRKARPLSRAFLRPNS